MTITDNLRLIANRCVNSDEFVKRAKLYLAKNVRCQNMFHDSELREMYREVSLANGTKFARNKYVNTILPALKGKEECKTIYYEAWCDLDESFVEKWFSCFRYMDDNAIIEACVNFLYEQDRFYGSGDYIDMLNTCLKHAKFVNN